MGKIAKLCKLEWSRICSVWHMFCQQHLYQVLMMMMRWFQESDKYILYILFKHIFLLGCWCHQLDGHQICIKFGLQLKLNCIIFMVSEVTLKLKLWLNYVVYQRDIREAIKRKQFKSKSFHFVVVTKTDFHGIFIVGWDHRNHFHKMMSIL